MSISNSVLVPDVVDRGFDPFRARAAIGGLVPAAVGGSERLSLTASCGPAFVTEVGWVLG